MQLLPVLTISFALAVALGLAISVWGDSIATLVLGGL